MKELKWFSWPGLAVVLIGQAALALARVHWPQDGSHLWAYSFLCSQVLLIVAAAIVHGRTLVQRLFLVIPYFLASMSFGAVMAFAFSTVSHPEAGLIVGLPWFGIALFVFWLVAKIVNRIEYGMQKRGVKLSWIHAVLGALLLLAGVTGLLLALSGISEEPPPPEEALAAGPTPPPPAPKDPLCPVLIHPGKSVGPVSIGMSEEKLKAAGFALSDWEGGQMPPLFVTLCEEGAAEVSLGNLLDKPECWRADGLAADPAAEGFDVFAAFELDQCQTQVLKSGDRLFYCREGGLLVGVGRRFIPGQGQEQKFDRLGVIRPGLRINHFPDDCRVMRLDRQAGRPE